MRQVPRRLMEFLIRMTNESGQALVEYGLILALIAVIALASLAFVGHSVSNALNTLANTIANP